MEQPTDPTSPTFPDKLFEAYENGKHRRYNLLFAVNGGAFAVAKLLGEKGAVGLLTPLALALGMIAFTAIMTFDIAVFGWKMREKEQPDKTKRKPREGMFALPGWIVLGAIWLLLTAGWVLVAFDGQAHPRTEGKTMQGDVAELIRVNELINDKENLGKPADLGDQVAPELVFQRRDGTVADRAAFFAASKPGKRVLTVDSVHVYGKRAVVACRVEEGGVTTHNVRLFVKRGDKWQVLAWANEPA